MGLDGWCSFAVKLTTLGVGVAVVWCVTANWPSVWFGGRKRNELSKDELLEILQDLGVALHEVFASLAQMSANVLSSMKEKGLERAIPQEQIEEIILRQGFEERISEVQTRTFDKFGTSKESVEKAVDCWKEDQKVQSIVDGVVAMRGDALKGIAPLLPGMVQLPSHVTPELVLEMYRCIQSDKIRRFEKIFSSLDYREHANVHALAGTGPSPELSKRLKSATEDAHLAVMNRYLDRIGSPHLYRHAVAAFSRGDNEVFKIQKRLADLEHSDKLVEVMRPKSSISSTVISAAPKSPACEPATAKMKVCTSSSKGETVLARIHPTLSLVDAVKLRKLLVCDGSFICLVLKNGNSSQCLTALNSFSDSIECKLQRMSGNFDLPPHTFIYILLSEAETVETVAQHVEEPPFFLHFKNGNWKTTSHNCADPMDDLISESED